MATQTSLVSLPTEVVLSILRNLGVEDLKRFAQACPAFRDTAQSALMDRRLADKWHMIDLYHARIRDNMLYIEHPIIIIDQIDGNRKVQSLIKKLVFQCSRGDDEAIPQVPGTLSPYGEKVRDLLTKYDDLRPFLSTFESFDADEIESLAKQASLRSPKPALLIAMSLMPNLVTLELHNIVSNFSDCCKHLIKIMRHASQRDRFPKIFNLILGSEDSERSLNMTDLAELMLIPTLRYVEVNTTVFDSRPSGIPNDRYFRWPLDESDTCQVETLKLSDIDSERENLHALISGMPNVKDVEIGYNHLGDGFMLWPRVGQPGFDLILNSDQLVRVWSASLQDTLTQLQLRIGVITNASGERVLKLKKCTTPAENEAFDAMTVP